MFLGKTEKNGSLRLFFPDKNVCVLALSYKGATRSFVPTVTVGLGHLKRIWPCQSH